MHGRRVQQRRAALLLHLRPDQRDHRLTQGLDAGGQAEHWLGWRIARRPRGGPLQAGLSEGAGRRGSFPAARSTTRAVGVLAGLWAYSTLQWLRYPIPTEDANRGRWECSPFWQPIQQADFFGNGTPALRERKHVGDLRLICQMLSGCSTTAAAYLAGQLPADEDGTHFLLWFMTWQEEYLR